eukprot:TRINITY_DN11952_c0_g1_i1.p1 TRINITY_DN11952_c0_g1~~TRINITY_DN11952_c0_g1_i1.p1  ORF type:complete len:663 (+),score=43.27 TRINITY_DN11952_c0_g1_i1:26-2014(+)
MAAARRHSYPQARGRQHPNLRPSVVAALIENVDVRDIACAPLVDILPSLSRKSSFSHRDEGEHNLDARTQEWPSASSWPPADAPLSLLAALASVPEPRPLPAVTAMAAAIVSLAAAGCMMAYSSPSRTAALLTVNDEKGSPHIPQFTESFNPTLTIYSEEISVLMKSAMTALSRGDYRVFQANRARVAALQKMMQDIRNNPESADEHDPQLQKRDTQAEEKASPPQKPTPGKTGMPVAQPEPVRAVAPSEVTETVKGSQSSRTPPTPPPGMAHLVNPFLVSSKAPTSVPAENPTVTIRVPDACLSYSQEDIIVSYGVHWTSSNISGMPAQGKVYRRYNDFKAFHERVRGSYSMFSATGRSMPPFPRSKVLGSTNRSKQSIEKRRQELERFMQKLTANPSLILEFLREFLQAEAGQTLPAENAAPTIVVKSVWQVPRHWLTTSGEATPLRICIWPFEIQWWAKREVLCVIEDTPISREEGAMRYRALLNFEQWIAKHFPKDSLPTPRHYQLFLYSPLAFIAKAPGAPGSPLDAGAVNNVSFSDADLFAAQCVAEKLEGEKPRQGEPRPRRNSQHFVAAPSEICPHATVRIVRNARASTSAAQMPAANRLHGCVFCCRGEQAAEPPEMGPFRRCQCTEKLICQVPGRAAQYVCDSFIIEVAPPP